MAYQEVTTTGYGTRVGNSFKAIGGGFLMFVLGTALLWWNEGRAVKTEKMLDEAGNAYVEMENPNKKDASLEDELICGTAMATTEDSLVDTQFGIGAKAISIRRNVEYYQWVEHSQTKREDKLGGKEVTTTTYTYTKEWVSSPIESSDFHDPAYQNKNSVLTTIDESEQWAENVKWGAYTLSESLFHRISSREAIDLAIAEDLLTQFDKSTQAAYERAHGLVTTAINKISQPAQPVQQPAQVAIPDSIKALLPDSVRAKLDSIQAVTDSLNKQMEANPDTLDILTPLRPVRVRRYTTPQKYEEVPFIEENANPRDRYTVYLGGANGNWTVVERTDIPEEQIQKTCLVISDSYGLCTMPFFAQVYDRVILYDSRYYEKYAMGAVSDLIESWGVQDIYLVAGEGNVYEKHFLAACSHQY